MKRRLVAVLVAVMLAGVAHKAASIWFNPCLGANWFTNWLFECDGGTTSGGGGSGAGN